MVLLMLCAAQFAVKLIKTTLKNILDSCSRVFGLFASSLPG